MKKKYLRLFFNFLNSQAQVKWTKSDFMIFFLLIPSILLITFTFPLWLKNHLILYLQNPTIISLFFSNYVHTDFFHFLSNLTSYLFIVFLLFNIETNKKNLYVASFLFLIPLPFILSLAATHTFPVKMLQGFSGIVSAFMGYFLYATYLFIKRRYPHHIDISFLYLLFITNCLIVTLLNLRNLLLFFVILCCFSYLGYTNRIFIKEFTAKSLIHLKKLKLEITPLYSFFIFIFSLYSLILGLYFLVPKQLVSVAGFVASPIHYLGFLFGYFIPQLFRKKD